jgi:hypothetical protein
MASIRPLKRRGDRVLHRSSGSCVVHADELIARMINLGNAHDQPRKNVKMVNRAYRAGSAEEINESVKDYRPTPHTAEQVGTSALRLRSRWIWAPVIVDCPVTALGFHHFLHGATGRKNDHRRSLVALQQTVYQQKPLDELRGRWHAAARDACNGASDTSVGWISSQQRDLLPVPTFAVTRPCGVDVMSQLAPLLQEQHDGFEAMIAVAYPTLLRVHDRRLVSQASSTSPPPTNEITLNPGDVAFIPRRLRYDLIPPTEAMSSGSPQSMLRSRKVLPLDMGIGPTPPPPRAPTLTLGAVAAADILRSTATTPQRFTDLLAWRWRFEPFPDYTDRTLHRELYVAANHMTSLDGLYTASSRARR